MRAVGRGGGAAGKCRSKVWVCESFRKHGKGFLGIGVGQRCGDAGARWLHVVVDTLWLTCCGIDIVHFPLSALRHRGTGWCSSTTWQGHSTPTSSWTSARRSSTCSRWCLGVNWCPRDSVWGHSLTKKPKSCGFGINLHPRPRWACLSTSSSPQELGKALGALPGWAGLWLRCRAGGTDQLSPGWIPLTAAGSAFGKTDANYFLIVLAFGASSLLRKKKKKE